MWFPVELGHAVWIHTESREMWILLTSRAARTVTWNFVKPAICFCATNYNVFADNVSLNVLSALNETFCLFTMAHVIPSMWAVNLLCHKLVPWWIRDPTLDFCESAIGWWIWWDFEVTMVPIRCCSRSGFAPCSSENEEQNLEVESKLT